MKACRRGRPPKQATAAVDGQFTSQKRFKESKGVGGAFVYSNWRAIMRCWCWCRCWTTKSRHSSLQGSPPPPKAFASTKRVIPAAPIAPALPQKEDAHGWASLASDAADASFPSSSQRGRPPTPFSPSACIVQPFETPVRKGCGQSSVARP